MTPRARYLAVLLLCYVADAAERLVRWCDARINDDVRARHPAGRANGE